MSSRTLFVTLGQLLHFLVIDCNTVFLFTWACLNLQKIEDKFNNVRKRHRNGRSAPFRTSHCIKSMNILLNNLPIGMKIHRRIAEWFF